MQRRGYNYNNYNNYGSASSGGTKNVPCKYFQMGKCNKGANCNYSHSTGNYATGGTSFTNTGGTIGNRFNNFSTNSNDTMEITSNAPNGKTEQQVLTDYVQPRNLNILEREIQEDMKEAMSEMVTDPLTSSYSSGYPSKVLLIDAARELSSQEIRWKYYQAQQANTLVQHENEMKSRKADIGKCLLFTKSNAQKAARYSQLGTQTMAQNNGAVPTMKPFIDFPLNTNDNGNSTFGGGLFGNVSAVTGNASPFGAPSTGVVNSNPFGGSPFGTSQTPAQNTALNTSSAFGTPAFGAQNSSTQATSTGGSAFGAPAFGSAAPASGSAFGAPAFGSAAPASGSAFGAPAFGKPAATGSPFGAPSFGSTASGSAFGAPAFGKPAATGSPFGAPAPSSTASAFGSLPFGGSAPGNSITNTASPFGSKNVATETPSPFGNSNTTTSSNTFGVSAFGGANTPATPSAFGAPAFGTSAQNAMNQSSGVTASGLATPSAFGTSGFGNSSNSTSGFGVAGKLSSDSNATVTPFGSAPRSAPSQSPFGNAFNTPDAKPNLPFGQSATLPNTQSGASSVFGQSGVAIAAPGSSAVNPGNNRFSQGLLDDKTASLGVEELSQVVLEQFSSMKFELGKVPDCPPPINLIT